MKKRELVFQLRLSQEESDKIFSVQKKTHLSKSEFCRRILLGESNTILTKENTKTRDDIRNLMQWTSINVNQIAKSLNGILKNDKPFELSSNQLVMIESITKLINTWAEAKRRIL